jgi:glucosamine 6-phosphate synthetase-like amidotransferase/phosphosugar isomerase protein
MVLVGAIASGVAFAKEIKKEVTFSQAVVVNGTVVKKGTYDAVFDDQTNELLIVKDHKVIARAPAQIEKREERDHAVYVTRQKDGDSANPVLLSIMLKDNNQATIVSSGDSAQ